MSEFRARLCCVFTSLPFLPLAGRPLHHSSWFLATARILAAAFGRRFLPRSMLGTIGLIFIIIIITAFKGVIRVGTILCFFFFGFLMFTLIIFLRLRLHFLGLLTTLGTRGVFWHPSLWRWFLSKARREGRSHCSWRHISWSLDPTIHWKFNGTLSVELTWNLNQVGIVSSDHTSFWLEMKLTFLDLGFHPIVQKLSLATADPRRGGSARRRRWCWGGTAALGRWSGLPHNCLKAKCLGGVTALKYPDNRLRSQLDRWGNAKK